MYYAAKKDVLIFEKVTVDFVEFKVFQTQFLAKKENLCPIIRASCQVVFVLLNYWGLYYQDYHIDSFQSYFLNFENVFVLSLKSFFTIWTLMEATNDLNSGDLEKVALMFKEHFYKKMSFIETSSVNFNEVENLLDDIDLETLQQDMIVDFVLRTKDKYLNESSRENEFFPMIRNQRISCMKKGSWFHTTNLKSEKIRCYRLSADEQYLYFQDFSEQLSLIPSIEELHSFGTMI